MSNSINNSRWYPWTRGFLVVLVLGVSLSAQALTIQRKDDTWCNGIDVELTYNTMRIFDNPCPSTLPLRGGLLAGRGVATCAGHPVDSCTLEKCTGEPVFPKLGPFEMCPGYEDEYKALLGE